MADLAKSSAQWLQFIPYELGMLLSVSRLMREMRDRMRYERVQFQMLDNRGTWIDTTGGTLAGVVPNQNTAVGGILYVRITGSGPYTVTLYKATGGGGGDAVAAGTAAAGATATLTASNSSGITGTWNVPAGVATTTDDSVRIYPIVDFPAWARNVWDGAGDRDSATLAVVNAGLLRLRVGLDSLLADWRSVIGQWAAQGGLNGQAFMGRSYPQGLIADTARPDASGAVSRIRTGFLPELKEAMADESGGEQDVVKRAVAAAAGVFAGANTGLGAVASHTPLEHCPLGVWQFSCVAGADNGQGGSERFNGTCKVAGTDEEFSYEGLVVGQQWSGPRGFGPITLTRTHSKTNDGSNNVLAAASGAVVTGAKAANTDNGTLYVKTEANASNWDISFFKSSNMTAGDLVAKATNIAGAAAFVASPKNGSGLTVSWTLGGSVSAVSTITLKLNFFVTQNSDSVPDQFSITTTLSTSPAGLIQDTVGEELGFALNSDTSGSESISDGYMKASTFSPMVVQDN